ncbi:MAG: esterase-like activity of phytase family protein, partial [Acidobacteriota bacterium]
MSWGVRHSVSPAGLWSAMEEPCRWLAGAACLLLVGIQPISALQLQEVFRLQFLGDAYLPQNLDIEDTRVGGLSGIAWNEAAGEFLAISDDPGSHGSARFYRLSLDLSEDRLERDGVVVRGVSILKDAAGHPYPNARIDPEGIALMAGVGVFVSSEGQIKLGCPPSLHLFDYSGNHLRDFEIPGRYFTTGHTDLGVRNNRAFESLTLTPDGEFLITATENALIQDGPASGLDQSSPARILMLDRVTGEVVAEHIYWTDPVAMASPVEGGSEKAGLVDLLALDRQHLIAVERSYTEGWGNSIRMYLVDLEDADDLSRKDVGETGSITAVRPAAKALLLDFADLGVDLDNIEGLAFGPRLQDGRRSLVLVGDDNFNPKQQRTQFLAFAVSAERPTVAAVQGAAHRSPLEGQWIRGLEGRVTAVSSIDGFWITSLAADEDPNTSEGLRV